MRNATDRIRRVRAEMFDHRRDGLGEIERRAVQREASGVGAGEEEQRGEERRSSVRGRGRALPAPRDTPAGSGHERARDRLPRASPRAGVRSSWAASPVKRRCRSTCSSIRASIASNVRESRPSSSSGRSRFRRAPRSSAPIPAACDVIVATGARARLAARYPPSVASARRSESQPGAQRAASGAFRRCPRTKCRPGLRRRSRRRLGSAGS